MKYRKRFVSSTAIRIKKPIKTKFRLPVFNWTALKPNQINGTVFNEIDDERVLEVSRADQPRQRRRAGMKCIGVCAGAGSGEV